MRTRYFFSKLLSIVHVIIVIFLDTFNLNSANNPGLYISSSQPDTLEFYMLRDRYQPELSIANLGQLRLIIHYYLINTIHNYNCWSGNGPPGTSRARNARGTTSQQLSSVLQREGQLREINRGRTRSGGGIFTGTLLVGVSPMDDFTTPWLAVNHSEPIAQCGTHAPITNLQTHNNTVFQLVVHIVALTIQLRESFW